MKRILRHLIIPSVVPTVFLVIAAMPGQVMGCEIVDYCSTGCSHWRPSGLGTVIMGAIRKMRGDPNAGWWMTSILILVIRLLSSSSLRCDAEFLELQPHSPREIPWHNFCQKQSDLFQIGHLSSFPINWPCLPILLLWSQESDTIVRGEEDFGEMKSHCFKISLFVMGLSGIMAQILFLRECSSPS